MLAGDLWRPIDPWTAPVTADPPPPRPHRLHRPRPPRPLARRRRPPRLRLVRDRLARPRRPADPRPRRPPLLARDLRPRHPRRPRLHPPGRSPHPLLPLRLEDRPRSGGPPPPPPHRAPRRPPRRPDPRHPAALALSAAAFVTLILATVTFDGLHLTFWWLARLGINPLEFPGRSAVTRANTLGLLAAWALTAAAILATVALTRRLANARTPFWHEAGPAMLSLLPIAAGYHAAHYLTQLLAGLRYALAALTRPPRPRRHPRLPHRHRQRPPDLGHPVRHHPRRPPPRRPRQPPPRRPPPGDRPPPDDRPHGPLHHPRPLAPLHPDRRLRPDPVRNLPPLPRRAAPHSAACAKSEFRGFPRPLGL